MTSEKIDERKKRLKETTTSNLEYVLQQHLTTFLGSFAAEKNDDKRALLIDAIVKFENADRPRKAFIIDASNFEDNQFRFVYPNGTIGDFYTNSTPAAAPSPVVTQVTDVTEPVPPPPLRSYLEFRRSTSGGRRRTNKHKKHHKKTKRY
jgi:hypothetical protein